MVCCIRQAATGDPPIGRGPARRVPSVKEQKQIQVTTYIQSVHIILDYLEALMPKYVNDTKKTPIFNLPCTFF